MKRALSAGGILAHLREAGRDTCDIVRTELCRLYTEFCADIVARVPDEVWVMVMREACARSGDPDIYFRLACVSPRWSAIVRPLVIERCGFNGPQCAREVRYCTDATHVVVTSRATLGNSDLHQLPHLTRLVDLVSSNVSFTAGLIATLTNLQVLHLHRTNSVWMRGFSRHLLCLTDLDLHCTQYCTRSVATMTNLTSLSIYHANDYDDDSLRNLTRLTHLNLEGQATITDDAVSRLTSLCSLNLGLNRSITIRGVEPLTGLKTLDLSYNNRITDNELSQLTQLETLILRCNRHRLQDTGSPV